MGRGRAENRRAKCLGGARACCDQRCLAVLVELVGRDAEPDAVQQRIDVAGVNVVWEMKRTARSAAYARGCEEREREAEWRHRHALVGDKRAVAGSVPPEGPPIRSARSSRTSPTGWAPSDLASECCGYEDVTRCRFARLGPGQHSRVGTAARPSGTRRRVHAHLHSARCAADSTLEGLERTQTLLDVSRCS